MQKATLKAIITTLAFVVVVLFILCNKTLFGDNHMKNEFIKIEILLNGKLFNVNDEIRIKYLVKNISKNSIRISQNQISESDLFEIYTQDMKKLKLIQKFEYAIAGSVVESSFVLIKAGDIYERTYTAVAKRGGYNVGETQVEEEGDYIDFQESFVKIPNVPGNYYIKGIFKTDEDAIKEGVSRFHFDNIISVSAESPAIMFSLE